jgi:hypothetical protein
MAMHAADNIKATTGIFDASLGAKGNETSGRAILARQKEGDTSNFHYADNLNITLRHVGRCMLSMIPRIYDAPRMVRILGEDEKPSHVQINQPTMPQIDDSGAIQTVLNDMTVGEYDVTVTSGPSYTTQRQEAAAAMLEFGQSWPKLMDIAGDKVVRAMDWPGAEDIAERIAKTIPPNILGDEEKKNQPQQPVVQTSQGPIPIEQAGPAMDQMLQHLNALQQQLQEASTGIEKEQIKAKAMTDVATINSESRKDVEEIKGLIAMLLEKVTPPPALAAELQPDVDPQPQQPAPDAGALLAQIVGHLNPPKRKTMQIVAPSGQVYHGQVLEEPHLPDQIEGQQ